eukprot:2121663-Karenia_brevis.AAC.1
MSLDFLLENQFVQSGFLVDDGIVHCTRTGSGMGLGHSGAVANSSFLHAMELDGAKLAFKNVLSQLGVICYK